MVVLGINSRAECFSHFHSRHCEINFFERRHRARIDAEKGHRRVTRPRLRIIAKETQGYLTGYPRVQSGTIMYGRGSLKVSGSRADRETVVSYDDDDDSFISNLALSTPHPSPTRCVYPRSQRANTPRPRCSSRRSMRIRGQETPEPDPRGQRSPRRAPLDAPLVAAVGAPRRRLAPDHRRLRTEGTRIEQI